MKTISIIGQKNVGKSSLFNLLTKSDLSTTINYSGYTRDCISSNIKIGPFIYKIYDTPGLDYEHNDLDLLAVKNAWSIIANSDLIIFLTDVLCNSILDKNLFHIIKKFKNKKIYLLNKIDLLDNSVELTKNYSLKNFLNISVKNNHNIDEIIKLIDSSICNDINSSNKEKKSFKIAIIGRQNVGKSSFFNKLINENISLVFDQRGTTRDFILNTFIKSNYNYTLTDTPGLKKFSSSNLDYFYFDKISNLVKLSDIIFFVSDVNDMLTKHDLFLINYILKFKKILIFIVNKSDLIKKKDLRKILSSNFKISLFKHIVFRFVSSKYNFGINDIFIHLDKMRKTKNKFESNFFLPSIKSLLDNDLKIKKVEIVNYYPFSLNIYTKKKILYNEKKHISMFFIKHFSLKNIPLKFSFK